MAWLRNSINRVSRCFRIEDRRGRTRNFVGDSRLNWRPTKSKPSVSRTILVFSGLRRSPPGGEEVPQPGEDGRFELPSRTGQDHESSGPGEFHPQALTE